MFQGGIVERNHVLDNSLFFLEPVSEGLHECAITAVKIPYGE